MSITLSDGSTTLDLPGGLDWTDRYAWSPVVQSLTRSLTGAAIVQVAALQAGRPITLEGHAGRAWMPRSTCDALRTWADVAGKQLTLVLHGNAYPVLFRHHDAPAFAARPVQDRANPPADWPHYATLKFVTR